MNCGGPDSGACDPRGRGLPHACANERGSPRGPTTRVCIACAVPSFFILRCSSSCAIADQNGFMIHLRFGFFWAVSLSDDALLKVTGNIRRQKATPVSPKFEAEDERQWSNRFLRQPIVSYWKSSTFTWQVPQR
ncbi:hypothetical protein C4D60_Mb03t18940 [Musa balbisiana]|uniref:Uncharacterized protein n=1 Tax=Musa balbisiana TaxID=52838 RepID=A0A4S8JDD6_MUSBA|nr:hypothetical protein C4D60_Mb03t18940 [Musa balbisiana]